MTKKERMLDLIAIPNLMRYDRETDERGLFSEEERKLLLEIQSLIRNAMPDVEDGGEVITGRIVVTATELNLARIPSLYLDVKLAALKELILAAWRESALRVDRSPGGNGDPGGGE